MILCSGDTFRIDDGWLSVQDAPRPELSGPLAEILHRQEKKIIEAALAESKGKGSGPNGAATKLGIRPSTLDSKIRQFQIEKRKFAGPY